MRHPVRLFENPLLERLTKAGPLTVVLVWLPLIGALAFRAMDASGAAWAPALGWVGLGLMAWSLFEYGLHRLVFHWQARSAWGRRLVFVAHGCHHADPEDPERAVMPPAASVPLAAVLYGIAALTLAMPARDAFFAGFLVGYLHYDLTHWACHQARLRGPVGRWLKRHHLRHHYAGADGNYGVGTPLWDLAFGSMLGRKSKS